MLLTWVWTCTCKCPSLTPTLQKSEEVIIFLIFVVHFDKRQTIKTFSSAILWFFLIIKCLIILKLLRLPWIFKIITISIDWWSYNRAIIYEKVIWIWVRSHFLISKFHVVDRNIIIVSKSNLLFWVSALLRSISILDMMKSQNWQNWGHIPQ